MPKAQPGTVTFSLRIADDLRDKIQIAAQEQNRSATQLITGFIEAGLMGAQVADIPPELSVLLNRIRDTEALTGNSWLDDVTTFGAVEAVASKWLAENRPRPRNNEQIVAASEKWHAMDTKLRGILGVLEEAGVVRPMTDDSAPTLRKGLLGDLALYPKTRGKLDDALLYYGLELVVDNDAEAVSWNLTGSDGQPVSEDDKLGYKAMLALVIPWHEQVVLSRTNFMNAWREDDAERAAGAALVKSIAKDS